MKTVSILLEPSRPSHVQPLDRVHLMETRVSRSKNAPLAYTRRAGCCTCLGLQSVFLRVSFLLTHQCVLHPIGPKTSPSNLCCLRCPASPWTPSSRGASGFSKRSTVISTSPAAAPAVGWRLWAILALARPPSSPALWRSAAMARVWDRLPLTALRPHPNVSGLLLPYLIWVCCSSAEKQRGHVFKRL